MNTYLIVATGKTSYRFYVGASSYKQAVENAADTLIESVVDLFHEVTDPNLDPVCYFAIQDEDGDQRNVFFLYIVNEENSARYSLKTFTRATDAVYLEKKFNLLIRRDV
jgi:hypothetical protein